MNAAPIIKPTKDLVEAVKTQTDLIPADPATITAITAIKQKATSPSYDQDTDSLEAIREAIDAIAAAPPTGPTHIYPETNPVSVLGGNGAWGSWVEIIPENTVAVTFELLGTCTRWPEAAASRKHWLQFGTGLFGAEVAKVETGCFHQETSTVGWNLMLPVAFPIAFQVPALTRVSARAWTDLAAMTFLVRLIYMT